MGIPKTHEGDIFNRALSRVGDARLVYESEKVVTAITAANPPVVSVAAHGYADGDRVVIYDLTGASELNGRTFEIKYVSAGTFSLPRETGSFYTAATAGLCRRLPDNESVRACYDAWPRIRDEIIRAHPWNSIVRRTRLYNLGVRQLVDGASQDNPVVVFVVQTAVTLAPGDFVFLTDLTGMIELNNRWFTVGNIIGPDEFELVDEDGTGHTLYTGEGWCQKMLDPLVPAFGYAYMYDLPEDCERVLSLEEDPDYEWETEGRQLLTDKGPSGGTSSAPTGLAVRYAKKIMDPDLYDSQLTTVLVARLACEISEELTQSTQKKDQLREDYENLMSEAKRLDAQEQSSMAFAEDDWVLARY
jgi:hypothetical protein